MSPYRENYYLEPTMRPIRRRPWWRRWLCRRGFHKPVVTDETITRKELVVNDAQALSVLMWSAVRLGMAPSEAINKLTVDRQVSVHRCGCGREFVPSSYYPGHRNLVPYDRVGTLGG